jgi:hypothetical protein
MCGKNVITFKKVVDNVKQHICYDCVRKTPEVASGFISPLENVFTMKWKLADETQEWVECFEEVSLSDIETIYGNNTYGIIWCKFWMKGRAMI